MSLKRIVLVLALLFLSLSYILTNPELRLSALTGIVSGSAYVLSLYSPPIEGFSYEGRIIDGLLSAAPRPSNRTIDVLRQGMQTFTLFSNLRKDVIVTPFNTSETNVLVMKLEPEKKTTNVVLIYLHGGYHVSGSWNVYKGLVAEIAHRLGGVTYFPEFRLAPEHPLPAATEDVIEAYKEIIKHHDPKDIFIAGDSAGGGQTALVLLKLKELGLPLPRGGWLLSPYTDLTQTGKSYELNKERDKLIRWDPIAPFAPQCWALGLPTHCHTTVDMERFKDPKYSPLYGNLAGFPSLLIHVSEHEVLYDDSKSFAEKAKESNVPVTFVSYPLQQHDFIVFFNFIPESSKAIDEGVNWILSTHKNK